MSLGILSGLGALPLVSFFTHLSQVARVNCGVIWGLGGPLLSSMIPSCVCQGYYGLNIHMCMDGL